MKTMKPGNFLHSLSLKLLAKNHAASPAAVAPCPSAGTPYHQWLASELESLRLHFHSNPATSWLSDALRLAATAQTKALQTIQLSSPLRPIDRHAIEAYLDDIHLLDAIDGVRRRIETIRRHTALFSTAIHRLECGGAAVDRARAELSPLVNESLCSLRRVSRRCDDVVLDGSRAVAAFVVAAVWAALFPKQRRGVLAGMEELRMTMEAAARLRMLAKTDQGRSLDYVEVKCAVEELRRRKKELEEGMIDLEEKVEELYRRLVAIRVFLLGVLSSET